MLSKEEQKSLEELIQCVKNNCNPIISLETIAIAIIAKEIIEMQDILRHVDDSISFPGKD